MAGNEDLYFALTDFLLGPGIALPLSGVDLVPADTTQFVLCGDAYQLLEEGWQTDHRNLREMTSPERKKNFRNYKIQKSYTLVF